MKHYWREAAFIPQDADDEAAWRIASRFHELREESFVGGFVLRRYEHFRGAEARIWWLDEQVRNRPTGTEPGELIAAIRSANSDPRGEVTSG